MTVPSPCILVCSIDPGTGWCFGCGRTGDEIMRWPTEPDAAKLALLEELPARLARVERPARRMTRRRARRET